MTNINIEQFNNIENINIGGTALLCSSNPHCILDFKYTDDEQCIVERVVERQGTILSIKLKNSNSTISALAKNWKLDMILVRGPPKIYNTFENSTLQNSLQFDLIHSLEGKKSNSETYVIVSFVAQINDIYSNNPSYSEINKIKIPSKADNYKPINIDLSPNSFFPTNENSFYQYNIPKTTTFNQIYMKNVRYLSSTFFNLFNNNILGGNYASLFDNYLKTSTLPVSPNPIFYNQNMPMYPLGTIMDCKTGCRKPDGNILESKPVENKEDSSIVPKIIEKLDAEDEKLPAKCFSKTTSTDSTTPKEESPEKCGKEITIGGKKIGYTQMITTCIFASIIAVFVSYIIYKIGNQAVNSNSKKVGVSFIVSWLGVFIIFLSYYIVLNGKNWKGYEEEKDAIEKKKNAYAGFTWATLLINMIILFGIAIFLFLKNKFNFSNNVIKIFKYAPLLILIVIFISAIVLGAKSYGKKCKKIKEENNEKESGEKSSTKRKSNFNLVIIMLFIAISLFGPELLILKNLKALSKPWKIGIGIIIALWVIFLILLIIFATITNSLLNKYNTGLPDDPDCRTQEQKDKVFKLRKYLQTELILLFAFIIQIFIFTLVLLSFWKNFRFSTLVAIFAGLMIIFQIIFIVIVKTRKYKDGKTLPEKCEKIDVDLNPLLITMGCMIGVWIIVIIVILVFRKKESTFALNAINSSNLSYDDKYLLRSAVGDGLFTTQSNRSKAVDILKKNPALGKTLANQGYSLDKIQNPKLADVFSTSGVPVKTLNSGVKSSGVLDLNKFNKKLNKSSLSGNDKKFIKNYLSSGNSNSQINKDKFAQLIAQDPSLKSYINKKGINLADIKSKTIPKLQTEIVSY